MQNMLKSIWHFNSLLDVIIVAHQIQQPIPKLNFHDFFDQPDWNGILLPKLFWPTVRKNCSTDREKLLKFEAEGREFAKFLRSLEQFIQAVKGQNNFW